MIKIIHLAAFSFCLLGFITTARAEDNPETSALSEWTKTIRSYGHVDVGAAFNPAFPSDGLNFGHLYTDKANKIQMNQLLVTLVRPINTLAPEFDVGFMLQGIFGTDARYTQAMAETEHWMHSTYQFGVTEASINMHIPGIFPGGFELKIGQMASTLMGAENADATANSLYSHSYISNFGTPASTTGFLITAHISTVVKLYFGLDSGLNGGFTRAGNMNDAVMGQVGFALRLLDGDLTITALSHIGAENPPNVMPGRALRYVSDATTVFKVSDFLTLTNDINYIQDNGQRAYGVGMAQYATYMLNDQWSLAGRVEVWRDNSGAFVAAYPSYFDAANSQRGLPAADIISARPTTYGEITFGLNYSPEVPHQISGFVVRPELRVDYSLSGSRPFNAGKSAIAFTPAVDVIVPF